MTAPSLYVSDCHGAYITPIPGTENGWRCHDCDHPCNPIRHNKHPRWNRELNGQSVVHIEVVRDHAPRDHNGAFLWLNEEAEAYTLWINGDPDDHREKPEPTIKLSEEDVNQLVLKWLRGPMGPPGPEGMMGASA